MPKDADGRTIVTYNIFGKRQLDLDPARFAGQIALTEHPAHDGMGLLHAGSGDLPHPARAVPPCAADALDLADKILVVRQEQEIANAILF